MNKYKILVTIIICILHLSLFAQQFAFPGAEGFGQYTKGGRGGIVLHVTNLNDSGSGSFREALTSGMYHGKKRTIVFDVSGTIELQSVLYVKYDSCITIAGQTAPGDGVCIKNFTLKISESNDIIIRYLRFRPGDEQDCGNGCDDIDALSFRHCYNVIVDHCSLSWSIDDVLDFTVSSGYCTVQWCMIYEPLNNSKHSKGAHGYIAGWDGGSFGNSGVFGGGSYHHNLLASGISRTPRLDKGADESGHRDLIDVANNVIYNWSGQGAYGGEAADVNWQNNYYKYGPNTTTKSQIFLPVDTCRMFVDGNYVDGNIYVTSDNRLGILTSASLLSKEEILQDEPFDVWSIDMQSAEDAYNSVLVQAGALIPERDTLDKRIISEVMKRTGKIIDSQSEVGGWPVLNSTAAPLDTDLDGMPDDWEDVMGLNKNNAADGNYVNSKRYTQLETYLNSLEFQNPVQNLTYKVYGENKAFIKWDDTYVGEDNFRIERSVNRSDFQFLANIPKNFNNYIDNNFYPSDEVNYQVIAVQQDVTETNPGEAIASKSIEIQVDSIIYVGDTINIGVSITPSNATNQLIRWTLDQQSQNVAEVNETGNLIAKNTGEVTVTAMIMDGSGVSVSKQVKITSPVSVDEIPDNLFSVYPNLSSDGIFYLNIAPEIKGRVMINAYNISGKKVYKKEFEERGTVILNHKFSEGIYLLYININSQNLVRKLVVYN